MLYLSQFLFFDSKIQVVFFFKENVLQNVFIFLYIIHYNVCAEMLFTTQLLQYDHYK